MASPASSSSSSSDSIFSSSSSTSTSSSIHPASLVDASLHSTKTLRLVQLKISKELVDHVVDQVIETVDFAMGKTGASSSRRSTRTPIQVKFTAFVDTVLTRAEITTPTLLASLVYIARARPYLHIALEEWALERVFLGALITASKYLNDSTLKNVHWALCTGVFGKRDVGRIEREFLAVLDWELNVSEVEIEQMYEGLAWAVEMEDREAEQRRMEKERKAAKMFYISPPAAVADVAPQTKSVPSLPYRPRNHRRTTAHLPHPISIPAPIVSSSSASSSLSIPSSSSSRPHSHSSSPSSSSSGSLSPQTPNDHDLAYPSHLELQSKDLPAHHPMDVDRDAVFVAPPAPVAVPAPTQQKRSLKRSFGATTIELLRSFPFHHSHHQEAQRRRS